MNASLSAFPLTPLSRDQVDERAFVGIVERLARAGVDSITVLGSTGSAMYLTAEERARVTRLAVEHSGSTPVFVGVSSLRTSHVLSHVAAAEEAGASGLLLAPVSYQPLTPNEVFELYRTVVASSALPVIVYDNPATTHFRFTIDLYARIAELPGISSIKIPAVPEHLPEAAKHVSAIRAVIPSHVTIGVSGDASAATGLNAGCDTWYSVIGGTLPGAALAITRLAQSGQGEAAAAASDRLAPLWELFSRFGSLRVTAAIAEQLGLAQRDCLPRPLHGLTDAQRAVVARVLDALKLGTNTS